MKFDTAVPIGQGAMGEVFKSWDPDLERFVALKLLRRVHEEALSIDFVCHQLLLGDTVAPAQPLDFAVSAVPSPHIRNRIKAGILSLSPPPRRAVDLVV